MLIAKLIRIQHKKQQQTINKVTKAVSKDDRVDLFTDIMEEQMGEVKDEGAWSKRYQHVFVILK